MSRCLLAALLVSFVAPAARSQNAKNLDGAAKAEDRLLEKFEFNQKAEAEKLKLFVLDATAKAKDLKDTDPQRGLDLLRQAGVRIDQTRILSYGDRKNLMELVKPLLQELRTEALLRKRIAACDRLDAFREYIEQIAPEIRTPGRSGPDHWEPAVAAFTNGVPRTIQLKNIGASVIHYMYGKDERNLPTNLYPWIQVFGGVYIYDNATKQPMYLSNREFYETQFRPLINEFVATDPRGRAKQATTGKAPADPLFEAEVDSGVIFLRGLSGVQPLPGISDLRETDFLEFAAQRIIQKGLPTPIDRIYEADLRDLGLSAIEQSAVRRSLFLLRAKGVASSKLYAEILREETASVIRSEYSGVGETISDTMNRVLIYVFRKLRSPAP
jgi:hypothetical protein